MTEGSSYSFSRDDVRDLEERGMTPEVACAQLDMLRHGGSYVRLLAPCTTAAGIRTLDATGVRRLVRTFDGAARAGRAMKFVPAAGAATRMFEDLQGGPPEGRALRQLAEGLEGFGFYPDLKALLARRGEDIGELGRTGKWEGLIDALLGPESAGGLGYAHKPKGLVKFHSYAQGARTAIEEQLAEAGGYVADAQGRVRVHFAVQEEHLVAIAGHVAAAEEALRAAGITPEVTISTQKPSTATIATDMHGEPFRDPHGRLVFRPGGHGALIDNLAALDGEIVFIKNVDNVVPDRLKETESLYKRALGGLLVETRDEVHGHLRELLDGSPGRARMNEILGSCSDMLGLATPHGVDDWPDSTLRSHLTHTLARPIRVCGVVKNTGEPGGGPFVVRGADTRDSVQIVESVEVDPEDPGQQAIWGAGTHFNPVDIVCGLTDHRSEPHDLRRYIDTGRYFISTKSHGGAAIKALELPGLWNGAMAGWNTLLVEVPLSTFNPVKTVFDLLRPEHSEV